MGLRDRWKDQTDPFMTKGDRKLKRAEEKLAKKRSNQKDIFTGTRKGKVFGDGYKD